MNLLQGVRTTSSADVLQGVNFSTDVSISCMNQAREEVGRGLYVKTHAIVRDELTD